MHSFEACAQMTCADFQSLIRFPRSHEPPTRAERHALLKHVIECPECLEWTARTCSRPANGSHGFLSLRAYSR
jgi:hypothetical protein